MQKRFNAAYMSTQSVSILCLRTTQKDAKTVQKCFRTFG